MCGITGFYSQQRHWTVADIDRMNQAQAHRGPDADGSFVSTDGMCGLGHRRLSILDLSTASHQPFFSEDRNWVMVFNGEIYNFKSLRSELEQKGYQFTTSGDTEVLLKAYQCWGKDILPRLNGMFAFAIWNVQEQSLCIARDRIGEKPLFLYQGPEGFAFASELKALQALLPKSSLPISDEALHWFLHVGYIPGPMSIYQTVTKIKQGSWIQIQGGKITHNSYWELAHDFTAQTMQSESDAQVQLTHLIEDAVRIRLESDVPFGAFLSGGVDSSLVSAVASKHLSAPLQTFSIGFKEQTHNESQYAEQVAQKIGAHHTTYIVTEDDAKQLVDRFSGIYDEPYADSSGIPTYLVASLARKEVKMVLTGDGGDELFMGYGAYRWANRMHNPLIFQLRKPIAQVLQLGDNRMKRAARVFNYQKGSLEAHIFSQEQYFFSHAEISTLLKSKQQLTPLAFHWPANRTLTAAEKQSFFDARYYLCDDLLVKVDRATMQHGLEARVPLLDSRIIAFSAQLNQQLKMHGKTDKYILKKVLYQYLPSALFERPKWGFSIPLGKWLQQDLRYLIEQYLSVESLEKTGKFDVQYVQNLITAFYGGQTYVYNRIWALVLAQQWLLKHG